MLKHYVKILPWIEPYARQAGATKADWALEIFDDLTNSGRGITVHEIPPDEFGRPRLAAYGSRFFAECGIDKDRVDTVFVSRIEKTRPPRTVPSRLEVELVLVRQAMVPPEPANAVAPLFGVAPTPAPEPVRTSARVSDWLRDVPEATRGAWGPSEADQSWEDGAVLIAELRRVWARHRVDRFSREMGLAPRVRNILSGLATPGSLTEDDRQRLLGIFGVRGVAPAQPDSLGAHVKPPELSR
jgi:hypothetical protein